MSGRGSKVTYRLEVLLTLKCTCVLHQEHLTSCNVLFGVLCCYLRTCKLSLMAVNMCVLYLGKFQICHDVIMAKEACRYICRMILCSNKLGVARVNMLNYQNCFHFSWTHNHSCLCNTNNLRKKKTKKKHFQTLTNMMAFLVSLLSSFDPLPLSLQLQTLSCSTSCWICRIVCQQVWYLWRG